MQVAGETFEIFQSNVLQGSKVILDVEEEGLNERTILSFDAATKISSSGMTCFRSSDGKEHCFVDAQPGQCDSFGGPERLLQKKIDFLGDKKKDKMLVQKLDCWRKRCYYLVKEANDYYS